MKPKSLLHCHSKNLHSVIIGRDTDDNLMRMFVATKEHNLHKNSLYDLLDASKQQELAIHAHKSDITLIPLTGTVYNIIATKGTENLASFNQYQYHSPILNNVGGFRKTNGIETLSLNKTLLSEPLYLEHSILHTIFVPENTEASWLVVEGNYTKYPSTLCYSNKDLESWRGVGLNQEMDKKTEHELKEKYFYNRTTIKKINIENSSELNNTLHLLLMEYVAIVDYTYDELAEKYREIRDSISHEVNYGSIHSNRYSPDYIPRKSYADFSLLLNKLAVNQ